MQRFSIVLLVSGLMVLGFLGCNGLIPGEPPPGDIVENGMSSEGLSPRKAENLLITALGLYMLQEAPGAGIALNADEATFQVAVRVLKSVSTMSGAKLDPVARLELRSSASENGWQFKLVDRTTGEVRWERDLTITTETSNP